MDEITDITAEVRLWLDERFGEKHHANLDAFISFHNFIQRGRGEEIKVVDNRILHIES